MSDTDAINAIIELLEDTVQLLNQYDPLASSDPNIAKLLSEVTTLKSSRGL